MLSNNLRIICENNVSKKKNMFKLSHEYHDLCPFEKKYIISYITYLKDETNKDRLVYSARSLDVAQTWYDKESTRICEIKNNKIINDKELIRYNNISHNLTLFNNNNNIIGYGGVFSQHNNSKNKKGIFSFKYNNDKISNIRETVVKKNTIKCNYDTAFDSNICCVKYNNKFYLYTRYNKATGIRKTQLLISDKFDCDFKSKSVVYFNDPTVLTYMQNIYIENDIFIGIFRIYRKKNSNSHSIYDSDTKIKYILAHSFDGINFIIDNEDFIDGVKKKYYIISTNYKKNGNKKNFFFSIGSMLSTKKKFSNIIKEYEIRDGGYINYETKINSEEGELFMEIQNDKKTILLNYIINNDGYINLFFIDKDKNEILKKNILIKDHTNNRLDLPANCKFIKIKFYKSKIYQIL